MSEIKFGWRVPAFPADDSRGTQFAAQIAQTLARIQGKFSSAWIADHFIPWADFVADDVDTLECLTSIAYLAGAFPQLDFGSIVLCQSYRNPALLAKMGATLQLLTNGRFILGIGAGWKDDEYLAYNYPFPTAPARIAQLSEAVQIIRQMWTAAPASFSGDHYQIKDAYCSPQPSPRPPIMIGGGGEKLTLRVVAQYADWWNIPGGSVENYAHKLEILRGHCDAVGRNHDEIVKTWSGETVAIAETDAEARRIAAESPFGAGQRFTGTPDKIAAELRRFTDLGVEHFILRFADFPSTAGVGLFADQVVPQFK